MNDDWYDMLVALLESEARFLVVGAHAMAAHGVPRGTQDLDVWIDPDPPNARRVWHALAVFGAPVESLGVTPDDLQQSDTVVQLGLPPNRLDLLTSITGVPDFASAWSGRVDHEVRGQKVPLLFAACSPRRGRSTRSLRMCSRPLPP